VPVSGRAYKKYGGNTTCVQIETARNEILILDAGTGIRELGNRLIQQNGTRVHLLLTHFHWDHIQGFPFFKPAYRKDVQIDVYGKAPDGLSLQSCLEDIVAPPHFPIPPSELKANIEYHPVNMAPFESVGTIITPVPLNHPNQGVGYKIEEDGQSFVFLTDNELGFSHPTGLDFQRYVDFVQNADLLIHDAEYMPDEYPNKKGWGHSTVDDAVRLALEADVKQLGLFHHNQDRTDAAVDALVQHARKQAQSPSLTCFGVQQGMEIKL